MHATLFLLAALAGDTVDFPLEGGGRGSADRGLIEVPLIRSDPEGAKVQVEYHRFRSEAELEPDGEPAPPIFFLNGGPGFRGLGPELRRAGFYEQTLRPLARIADVVVVGQRGIGTSTPDTVCGAGPREDLTQPVDFAARAEQLAEACRACRARWEAEGLDEAGFNVLEAAADVIAVADELGYERITLTGSSFGSHWAMAILREHEGRVARAVLGGIEGPDHTYDSPSHVLAALERVAAAAESDPAWAEHVPEGGFLAAFKRLVARIEEEPVRFKGAGKLEVLLDAHRVRDLALGFTGRASTRDGLATWPRDILALVAGEHEQAAQKLAMLNFVPVLPTASFFQLDCGSGISAERLERLLADPAAAVVGPLGWYYEAACPAWDGDLGEDFRAGFETDVPTLLVQGTWDTSTPFENALEVLPCFTNGQLVVVEGGSHRAMSEAMAASPAFVEAVMRFLSTGERDGLPERVELPPMKWALPD